MGKRKRKVIEEEPQPVEKKLLFSDELESFKVITLLARLLFNVL